MKINQMKYPLIILFLSAFAFSCNNSNNSNERLTKGNESVDLPYSIDIERNIKKSLSIPMSSIASRLEYIPLETINNSLIGEIRLLEFSSNYIFIVAGSKLFQFDRKGKFVRQVGATGRGPGEYNGINSFCIDEKSEKVFVLTRWPSRLLEYNFNGDFIESSNIPWESTQMLLYGAIGLVFHIADDSNLTTHSGYNLYITDFQGNIIQQFKRHFIRESNLLINNVPLYFLNDKLHFKQYAVDTLYILESGRFEPYAIYNLGKEKMDPNLRLVLSASSTPTNAILENEYENKIEIKDILENQKLLFTKVSSGLTDSLLYFIFNKETYETTTLNNGGFFNDLDGGLTFWPKYVYQKDSILVDYCNSFTLLTSFRNSRSKDLREKYGGNFTKLENIIKELDEMSNPVLIILR